MKDSFFEADTGERMFWYSEHVKGPGMKEYKYDPIDSGRWARSLGLVCSALLFFSKDTHVLVCLTLHCWATFVVIPERNSTKKFSWGSGGFLLLLRESLVSSGLNYSCWFICGVCLPRGQPLSHSLYLLWDWTAAKEDPACPQRTIAELLFRTIAEFLSPIS